MTFNLRFAISFFIGFIVLPTSADAQDEAPDRVTLQQEGRSSRITVGGKVVDYTGRHITIVTAVGGQPRVYPAAQVIDVQTPQTEPHARGLSLFARNDIAAARQAFEAALNVETRGWVRRDILAMLIRCSLKEGDYQTAGSRFVLLVKSDPDTRHFRLIPLVWGPREIDAGLKGTARAWMAQNEDAARLLGASLLLDDPQYGAAAESDLKELSSSLDLRVQRLARAQRWRKRVQAGDTGRDELARWQEQIEALPQDIRGGPWYLLGRASAQRREYDRAAVALLWLPMVYDHDHHLAARACLEAADALVRLGQRPEATTLYREVAHRFADTPFAQDAAAALRDAALRELSR